MPLCANHCADSQAHWWPLGRVQGTTLLLTADQGWNFVPALLSGPSPSSQVTPKPGHKCPLAQGNFHGNGQRCCHPTKVRCPVRRKPLMDPLTLQKRRSLHQEHCSWNQRRLCVCACFLILLLCASFFFLGLGEVLKFWNTTNKCIYGSAYNIHQVDRLLWQTFYPASCPGFRACSLWRKDQVNENSPPSHPENLKDQQI